MFQVGAVEGVPAVLRRLEQRRVEDAAGIVDQDADRSERGHGPFEGGVDLARVADVDLEPKPADLVTCGGGRVGMTLPDGDLGTEGGESVGDASPDPRPPPVTTATRSVSRTADGSMGMS